MNIDRRDALAGMAAMFGATLFAPIARAAAAQVPPISGRPAERAGIYRRISAL